MSRPGSQWEAIKREIAEAWAEAARGQDRPLKRRAFGLGCFGVIYAGFFIVISIILAFELSDAAKDTSALTGAAIAFVFGLAGLLFGWAAVLGDAGSRRLRRLIVFGAECLTLGGIVLAAATVIKFSAGAVLSRNWLGRRLLEFPFFAALGIASFGFAAAVTSLHCRFFEAGFSWGPIRTLFLQAVEESESKWG